MQRFGFLALIFVSICKCALVPARFVVPGAPLPISTNTPTSDDLQPLTVSLAVFSGVNNPTWTVYPGESLYETLALLLNEYESTPLPSILGYRGFEVVTASATNVTTVAAGSNGDLESILFCTGLGSNTDLATIEIVQELACMETTLDTFCKACPTTISPASPATISPSLSVPTDSTTQTTTGIFSSTQTESTSHTPIVSSSSTSTDISPHTVDPGSETTVSSSTTSTSSSSTPTHSTASSSATPSTSTQSSTPPASSSVTTPGSSQTTSLVTTSTPSTTPKQCKCPKYEPGKWNNDPEDKENNNCYNYATNTKSGTYAQPGRGSGQIYTSLTKKAVMAAAIRDGLKVVKSPADVKDGECLVALVVWHGKDFHWYRRDANGKWSHKPGETAATGKDNSGKEITDPKTADTGKYEFVAYMTYCPGKITVKK